MDKSEAGKALRSGSSTAAKILGRAGGKVKSPQKAMAARRNGRKNH